MIGAKCEVVATEERKADGQTMQSLDQVKASALDRAVRFAPSFELAMARNDLGLMLATAGPRPPAVLSGIAARVDQLIAAGHGADDVAILAIDALKR